MPRSGWPECGEANEKSKCNQETLGQKARLREERGGKFEEDAKA